jgi:protein TonB
MQQNKLIRSAFTVPISFTIKINETHLSALPDGYISTDQKFTEEDADKIYMSAEKAPSFPGGEQKFQEYITESLKTDKFSTADAGKVYVSFVVDRDGTLRVIRVSKSVSQTSDAAALRLLKASPKWEPAMMKGRPVRFSYSCAVEIKPNI